MNYLEIFQKENDCHLRHKEVCAISRRLRGQFTWSILGIDYAGGLA